MQQGQYLPSDPPRERYPHATAIAKAKAPAPATTAIKVELLPLLPPPEPDSVSPPGITLVLTVCAAGVTCMADEGLRVLMVLLPSRGTARGTVRVTVIDGPSIRKGVLVAGVGPALLVMVVLAVAVWVSLPLLLPVVCMAGAAAVVVATRGWHAVSAWLVLSLNMPRGHAAHDAGDDVLVTRCSPALHVIVVCAVQLASR